MGGKRANSRSRGDRPLTNPARVPNTLWRIEVNRATTVMKELQLAWLREMERDIL